MTKRPVSPLLRLTIGAALLCGFAALLALTYGSGPEVLLGRVALFYSFAERHAWLLLGLYVLRLLFFLPASFVLLLTGMICGPWLGELVAVAGLSLSGSIEFLLVRGSLSAVLPAQASRLLQGWRERINRAPFHAILTMRLCFIPFDAVNIAAAFARAPFRPFLLASAVGVAPTSLPIVVTGASIDFQAWIASGRLWPGEGAVSWPYVGFSMLLLGLIWLHARLRGKPAAQRPGSREPRPPR